jgi:peptidoglycan/xylan/chitin deacetylase (PgdA/CDA1 family)
MMPAAAPLPRWLRVGSATGLSHVANLALRRHPTIIMYHGVAEDPLPHRKFFPNDAFVAHLDAIARRYTVVSMERIAGWMEGGDPPPPNAMVITFDDGYANLLECAIPELRRRGMPATIYVTSASLTDRDALLWFDEVECRILAAGALPSPLELAGHTFALPQGAVGAAASTAITRAMKGIPHDEKERVLAAMAASFPVGAEARARYRLLDHDDMRALPSYGIEIGGHTVRHVILARETAEVQRREIAANFELIRSVTGVPPVSFAYPNGRADDVTADTVRISRETGYRVAVTAEAGIVRRAGDLFTLPRISANYFGAYGLDEHLSLLPLRIAAAAVTS